MGTIDYGHGDGSGVKFCNYRLPGPCKSDLSPWAENPLDWKGYFPAIYRWFLSSVLSGKRPLSFRKKFPRKIRCVRTDVARKPPSLDLVGINNLI
jgi:hypothetical protein